MKLLSFAHGMHASFGITRGNEVLDVPALFHTFGGNVPGGGSLRRFLSEANDPVGTIQGLWEKVNLVSEEAFTELRENHVLLPADHIIITAPITNPSKIIAVGLNYLDHCQEQKVSPPKSPVIFAKFPNSIVGDGAYIEWDPLLTGKVDYEAELGVVIGRRAKGVSAENALHHVFGYTVVNDVSARDLQFGDKQWVRGKSLDTFCPMGPVIVTANDIPDPQSLAIRCRVNGEVRQDSNTRNMIFSVADLISFISHSITLEPGDVIATGTPSGVGVFREPALFLQNDDEVEVEIEHVGLLRNRCRTRS